MRIDDGPRTAGRFGNELFRECPELAGGNGTAGTMAALRCFRNDGSHRLMAGLYPSDIVTGVDEHWAYGEAVTSEADAALARDAAGGRPGREVAILLGIALERLKRQPRRLRRRAHPEAAAAVARDRTDPLHGRRGGERDGRRAVRL